MSQNKLLDALTSIHHRVSFRETHGNGQQSTAPEEYWTYEQVLAEYNRMRQNLHTKGLQSLVCNFKDIQETKPKMTLEVFQHVFPGLVGVLSPQHEWIFIYHFEKYHENNTKLYVDILYETGVLSWEKIHMEINTSRNTTWTIKRDEDDDEHVAITIHNIVALKHFITRYFDHDVDWHDGKYQYTEDQQYIMLDHEIRESFKNSKRGDLLPHDIQERILRM